MNNMPVIEARGWKEICALIKVKHKNTAKKILGRLGIKYHDGNKPCLNVDVYSKASAARHLTFQGKK